ncbi:LacI family DNA-binding transcriptional regulator [Actinomyces provencensis]|uniref:LacI family DNA-binding transcriptional regulator n=1 Tax=Actinomyces provencensis TaxID=1720198 RepID=UPI00096A50CF|nr:LacI family DNA-binding transcriptional regulator [Actinomyces provencensis]
MAQQRVGIRDVAREAGVSVTTVSHILNNVESARVSETTRQRVKATAARLDYGPNLIARGLRRQQSDMIGLLSEEIATTPHAGRIILGAQNAARAHGLTLVLINTTHGPTDIDRDVHSLLRQQVDGVLYATMYHREVDVPLALLEVPTVLIDAVDRAGRVPAVVPDEQSGAHAAVLELLRAGHRRIGFATNTDDVPATRGRLAGYMEALNGAGVSVDPRLIVARESETYGGRQAALELLSRADRPTALFCYNDRMAMGAYRAAAELGLRIPTDLSIVGFDNQELIAEGLFPSLTTVALPHLEMGEWAVERLSAIIRDQSSQTHDPEDLDTPDTFEPAVLECPLVPRRSVAAPHWQAHA